MTSEIERDKLIADFDKVQGPADTQAVAAKQAQLTSGGSDTEAAA